ncbi:MAG: TIGR01777 family protein [Candidatus Nitronauta litoralis]|uniref:TIGR01777 family protein n=1 Tax=Candidatus Nitronauta litoralis TaxID=2705533 RepID=A0A7T0BUD6_9BACT|nr:MAG: TIGR01777 family protein [Candidatus Nitronauta litoralis]
MNILVTGATGFIGREVLLHLAKAGHKITVLTRDPKTAPVKVPVNCRFFQWDSSLLQPPEEAFEGIDGVVHLAGENIIGRWTKSRKTEIKRSRVLSTHHLVEAFKKLEKKPEVFICASGIGIYGDRQAVELDDTASVGDGFLSELCQAWEEEALKAETLGIRTVPFRIGVVLGRRGGAFKMMSPPFRLGLGGRIADGEQWMSWIHVTDLARMVVHVLDQKTVSGPVNAVSSQPIQNGKFSKLLGKVLKRPAFIPVPRFVVKLVLGEASSVVLGSLKVLPRKIEQSGFQFNFPDPESALGDLCQEVTQEFRMEMWVPWSQEKVFNFFSDAGNLERITPPHLSFNVLRHSTPEMTEGTRINYRLKLHGFPICWQSLITDWRPPERFSDFQVVGPYWMWYHTHEFVEKDGGTLIIDRATYRVPFWVFGDVLGAGFIKKDLEKIFLYRREIIAEMMKA